MSQLEEFAGQLMRIVRDRAIDACDALNRGAIAGPQGDRWRRLGEPTHEALETLIPDIVDQVLFELLAAADSGELPLAWRDPDGTTHDLEQIGASEMAGWLMLGVGGWRDTKSSHRFNDDNAGLQLDVDWGPESDR